MGAFSVATRVGIVAAGLVSAQACAQFYSVGTRAPYPNGSEVHALSSDGRHAAGTITEAGFGSGFIWDAAAGRHDFDSEPGVPHGEGLGISGDGSVVVGSGLNPQGKLIAAKWSGPGTFQILGLPSGRWTNSRAVDASADGSVIVGVVENGFVSSRPFRWTQAGGVQFLDPIQGSIYSEATAVSDDGTQIAGWTTSGITHAFVWTQNSGYRYLGPVPNTDGTGRAFGMSSDGSFVVGDAGGEVGVLWSQSGAVNLDRLANSFYFRANAVDDRGEIVVGWSEPQAVGFQATIWTATSGLGIFQDYLAAQGVLMPDGVTLLTCDDVSADGLTFGGTARLNDTGQGFGYVVHVPSPPTFFMYAAVLFSSLGRRRTSALR